MQEVLHSVRCTAVRQRGSSLGNRGVHMHKLAPGHRGRVQLEVRVRAQRHKAVTAVGLVLLGMCVAQGPRARGRAVGEVRSGEHAATEERGVRGPRVVARGVEARARLPQIASSLPRSFPS